jgi:hypothetical protein
LHITRFPSLTESQFRGCVSAFVDSLFGELNSAVLYLRKLENRPKGEAFAHEASLDRHRYGAAIVLERWAALATAFAADPALERDREILGQAPARVQAAEDLLVRVNRLIDAADAYTADVVNACMLAYRSLQTTFQAERTTASASERLGPMLPDDYRQARRIFLEDLAAR